MNVLDLNVKLHWKIVFLFSKINLKAILEKKIYTDFKLTWRKLATNSTHRQANNLQIKHTKSVFHNTYIWKYRFDILSIFIHLLCSTITYPAVPQIVFFTLQYLPCPPPSPKGAEICFVLQYLPCPPGAEVFLALQCVHGQTDSYHQGHQERLQHTVYLVEGHCQDTENTI